MYVAATFTHFSAETRNPKGLGHSFGCDEVVFSLNAGLLRAVTGFELCREALLGCRWKIVESEHIQEHRWRGNTEKSYLGH